MISKHNVQQVELIAGNVSILDMGETLNVTMQK